MIELKISIIVLSLGLLLAFASEEDRSVPTSADVILSKIVELEKDVRQLKAENAQRSSDIRALKAVNRDLEIEMLQLKTEKAETDSRLDNLEAITRKIGETSIYINFHAKKSFQKSLISNVHFSNNYLFQFPEHAKTSSSSEWHNLESTSSTQTGQALETHHSPPSATWPTKVSLSSNTTSLAWSKSTTANLPAVTSHLSTTTLLLAS